MPPKKTTAYKGSYFDEDVKKYDPKRFYSFTNDQLPTLQRSAMVEIFLKNVDAQGGNFNIVIANLPNEPGDGNRFRQFIKKYMDENNKKYDTIIKNKDDLELNKGTKEMKLWKTLTDLYNAKPKPGIIEGFRGSGKSELNKIIDKYNNDNKKTLDIPSSSVDEPETSDIPSSSVDTSEVYAPSESPEEKALKAFIPERSQAKLSEYGKFMSGLLKHKGLVKFLYKKTPIKKEQIIYLSKLAINPTMTKEEKISKAFDYLNSKISFTLEDATTFIINKSYEIIKNSVQRGMKTRAILTDMQDRIAQSINLPGVSSEDKKYILAKFYNIASEIIKNKKITPTDRHKVLKQVLIDSLKLTENELIEESGERTLKRNKEIEEKELTIKSLEVELDESESVEETEGTQETIKDLNKEIKELEKANESENPFISSVLGITVKGADPGFEKSEKDQAVGEAALNLQGIKTPPGDELTEEGYRRIEDYPRGTGGMTGEDELTQPISYPGITTGPQPEIPIEGPSGRYIEPDQPVRIPQKGREFIYRTDPIYIDKPKTTSTTTISQIRKPFDRVIMTPSSDDLPSSATSYIQGAPVDTTKPARTSAMNTEMLNMPLPRVSLGDKVLWPTL